MSGPRKNPSRGPDAKKPTVGNDDNAVDSGSNNGMNGNLEASNPQPSPMASSPTRPSREVPDDEDFDCRPAGPPKRTTTSSSQQQQNVKSASSSATKQKREGKLASPMKGSSQKKNATNSKATKQVDKKKGVRTTTKSSENSSQKTAAERPNAQNSVLLSPSSRGSSRSDRGIEKTRVTTRAASAGHDRGIEKTRVTTRAASSSHDRDSSSNNNGNGSEDENDYRDDCSLSTAPAPPSLRVGNHYSLRPGAYRMGLGGVARYVDGANDDIDNYSTTNMEDSVLGDSEAVDTVALDARLVEEESILSPPLYRPTTSEGYTVSDQRTYGYDRSVQENSEHGCRSADHSTVGVTSTAPTATTFTSRTTTVMEEENSYVDEDDTDVVKSFKKRNMKIIVSSVFLFIIVIASVGAAYSVKRSRRNNNQITPLDPLQSFIETLPDHTKASLRIENSPQSKAIDWMSKYDDFESYPLPRQLQRFVLMSLTYSVSNADLSHEALQWMARLTDECVWYQDASKCEDNIYTELSLHSVHPLQGTIIPELALLTSLESLQIDQNELVGMIPTEIGQMTALKRIHMNNNLFRGTIPTEFGKLTNLEEINLSDNMLSGSIPAEIVSWNKVHTLLLAHNNLSGTIPTELGRMTQLTTVSLASNKLEGQLPPTVRLLKTIQRFDIKDNFIDGEFVSKFELMGRTLKFLQLGSNDFAGTLSSKIGLLTNLEVLDISNNEMKGALPEEVGLMTSLINLRLNSNAFDDLIPPELGLLSNAQSMALHGNQFTGSVPFEICELTTLTKKELTVDCDLVFCLCCTCG